MCSGTLDLAESQNEILLKNGLSSGNTNIIATTDNPLNGLQPSRGWANVKYRGKQKLTNFFKT